MRHGISKNPDRQEGNPAQTGHASLIGKVSVAYGACCSLATCAILLVMVVSRQSPLGFNISLLFLTVFWSGVPLLLLSVYSLRRRCTSRIVSGAALLLSFAPAAVCLFYPLAKIYFFGGDSSLVVITPLIALLFAPVVISLILLLLLISSCFAEKQRRQR